MKRFALALLALLPFAALAETPAAPPAAGASAHQGPITLSGGFARAMLPNQPVGGGYITIENTGTTPDRLVSVETPLAGAGELHEMAVEGDVMKMRALPEGIEIAAGARVELKPGGMHMMFQKVSTPFAAGGTVPLTLTFEKAGRIDIALPVLPAGASPEGNAGMHGMHSGHAMPGMKP